MKAWPIAVIAIAAAAAVTVGQAGRDQVPVLDKLPDWAGGRHDVTTCERYIGTGLAAPATYRRVQATRIDSEPLTQAAFDERAGIKPPAAPRRPRDKIDKALAGKARIDALMADLDRQRAEGRELRLRRVLIDYDATNALGVPIRASAACSFRLVDGKLDAAWALERRADRSDEKLQAAVDMLRGGRGAADRRSGCCL